MPSACRLIVRQRCEIYNFDTAVPRESCTNAKAKYSSSVVPPDPSVHFYHCISTSGWPIERLQASVPTQHYNKSPTNQNNGIRGLLLLLLLLKAFI